MNLGQRLSVFWQNFTGNTETMIALIVCVVVFAVLYYYLLKFLFDNNSGALVALFVFVMLIGAGIITFIENLNTSIYLIIPAVFIMATVVLYTVEIKRVLWDRRNLKLLDVKHDLSYDREEIHNCISEIIRALQNMSKNDVGAIIVLANDNITNQILDSGVKINSDISSELIESIFFPKTPLHDGAMIINGNKIVAAGCFLPLSQNVDNIPKDFGSRHRAGIGVTETLDVVSIIVSEETGIISIARAGKITRYADFDALQKTLNRYFWQELESSRR